MSESMIPRVLLVDDEQAVLLSHAKILERQGYTVVSAASFKRAIELVSTENFDLLICDLSLDYEASGLDVINIALQRDESLPVILLTGYSDAELPAEYSGETVKLLSKPAMIPELLDLVRALLGRTTEGRSKGADGVA
jgi:DNA-binding NtrC family response regulator